MDYKKYIKENTIRCKANHRGGGIELSLNDLLGDGYKMTAYQNYLGGGMLGSICNSYNFELSDLNKTKQTKIDRVKNALNRHFHSLTNHEGDEWKEASFEQNQSRPASAY